ncbi:unnamed protein product [Amoebophrya sp. A25]|nr:unnamed protein product [Amoebophrya sp. A25]|eukprot:GSA25T00018710001.1
MKMQSRLRAGEALLVFALLTSADLAVARHGATVVVGDLGPAGTTTLDETGEKLSCIYSRLIGKNYRGNRKGRRSCLTKLLNPSKTFDQTVANHRWFQAAEDLGIWNPRTGTKPHSKSWIEARDFAKMSWAVSKSLEEELLQIQANATQWNRKGESEEETRKDFASRLSLQLALTRNLLAEVERENHVFRGKNIEDFYQAAYGEAVGKKTVSTFFAALKKAKELSEGLRAGRTEAAQELQVSAECAAAERVRQQVMQQPGGSFSDSSQDGDVFLSGSYAVSLFRRKYAEAVAAQLGSQGTARMVQRLIKALGAALGLVAQEAERASEDERLRGWLSRLLLPEPAGLAAEDANETSSSVSVAEEKMTSRGSNGDSSASVAFDSVEPPQEVSDDLKPLKARVTALLGQRLVKLPQKIAVLDILPPTNTSGLDTLSAGRVAMEWSGAAGRTTRSSSAAAQVYVINSTLLLQHNATWTPTTLAEGADRAARLYVLKTFWLVYNVWLRNRPELHPENAQSFSPLGLVLSAAAGGGGPAAGAHSSHESTSAQRSSEDADVQEDAKSCTIYRELEDKARQLKEAGAAWLEDQVVSPVLFTWWSQFVAEMLTPQALAQRGNKVPPQQMKWSADLFFPLADASSGSSNLVVTGSKAPSLRKSTTLSNNAKSSTATDKESSKIDAEL